MCVLIPRGTALAAPAARWLAACLALSAMVFPACAQTAPPWPGNDHADPIRPDPRLTPGAVATSDPDVFCHAGYSRSVRHTSGRVKRQVCQACGIDRRSGSYEIDHLVPPAIGGSDEPATQMHADVVEFGDDVDHAADRDRVDGVVVAEHPDVVVPGQPDPQPQTHRGFQRRQRQHRRLVGLEQVDRAMAGREAVPQVRRPGRRRDAGRLLVGQVRSRPEASDGRQVVGGDRPEGHRLPRRRR